MLHFVNKPSNRRILFSTSITNSSSSGSLHFKRLSPLYKRVFQDGLFEAKSVYHLFEASKCYSFELSCNGSLTYDSLLTRNNFHLSNSLTKYSNFHIEQQYMKILNINPDKRIVLHKLLTPLTNDIVGVNITVQQSKIAFQKCYYDYIENLPETQQLREYINDGIDIEYVVPYKTFVTGPITPDIIRPYLKKDTPLNFDVVMAAAILRINVPSCKLRLIPKQAHLINKGSCHF